MFFESITAGLVVARAAKTVAPTEVTPLAQRYFLF
jgi:hypothetical protein